MTKPSMVGSSSKFKSCPSPEKVPLRDLISSSRSSIDPMDVRDTLVPALASASVSASSSANSSISIASSSASYTIQPTSIYYVLLIQQWPYTTVLYCLLYCMYGCCKVMFFTSGDLTCKINHMSMNYIYVCS